MFDIKAKDTTLDFSFSSRMEMVDRVLPVILDFIEEFDESGSTDHVPLVMRELLCNAIEHGNKSDINKKVSGSVEKIDICRYKITVKDEGDGWSSDEIAYDGKPNDVNGRSMGFSIINNFCDEISFSENESSIVVYMGLDMKTEIEVENEDDITHLLPTGDLTASMSEKFRDALINWFDSGKTQCNLDLHKVESIDSISLGVLVSFYRMIQESSETKEFSITNTSNAVMDVFQLTQIYKMFSIKTRS